MPTNDNQLTQLQVATLKALADACNYSLSSHPPEQAILRKFPKNLRGDAKDCLKWLHRKGLCAKHPTHGQITYQLTQEGLRLAYSL